MTLSRCLIKAETDAPLRINDDRLRANRPSYAPPKQTSEPVFGSLGAPLGLALWHRSPARFIETIDAGGVVGQAAAASIATIPAAILIDGLQTNPHLSARIVASRPELLELVDFWKIADVDDALVERADPTSAVNVALALLSATRTGAAAYVVAHAPADDLATALNQSDGYVFETWLHALVRSPDKVASVLASGGISRSSVVVRIARASDPDDVPNEVGDDPWLAAIQSASGPLEQSDGDYLASFIMARGLGFRSRSPANLIRFSYTNLYKAFEQKRLYPDAERVISYRLDWGSWLSWDNCARLRDTVVARFVNYQFDPETFGRLTDDGVMSQALFDEAARGSKGRKYLDEVAKQPEARERKGNSCSRRLYIQKTKVRLVY